MTKRKRIIVALSGGVDSSVAALILVNEGHDVIGVMLKLWNDPEQSLENRCCSVESMIMARNIAGKLNIPFYVIDSKKVFQTYVFENFLDGYINGITPNPCIICNKRVKWHTLLQNAEIFGADYIATGHYARIRKENSKYELLRGCDTKKDQSYMLYSLNQNDLSKTLFPLGNLTKNQVIAKALELSVTLSQKPESQDLCFLAGRDYRDLLSRYHPEIHNPGAILDDTGKSIGTHKGLAFYTIGQRRYLGLNSKSTLYVINKDISNNTLTVGTKNQLLKSKFMVYGINWISGQAPKESLKAQVQIRYRSHTNNAIISPVDKNLAHIVLQEPVYSVTPGQAAVFYNDDYCLGGGIIEG